MGILSNIEEELLPELPQFFENYQTDLNQLKQFLEDHNAEEIRNTVHRIKGSSGSWGFQKIHEAAVELENAAEDEDWETIESSLETLETCVNNAQEAVEQALEEQ
jgi:HPt (histidine-containing phosphotransfer) domain-containing protein